MVTDQNSEGDGWLAYFLALNLFMTLNISKLRLERRGGGFEVSLISHSTKLVFWLFNHDFLKIETPGSRIVEIILEIFLCPM